MSDSMVKKTLGPLHIWALGVGIVLVGDFMGWNLTVKQGGTIGAYIGLCVMSVMYAGQVLMTSEMGTSLPESGGQYIMAKYLLGPVGAFNVGLMQIFEYVMLEAGDIIVIGQLVHALVPELPVTVVSILVLLLLSYINIRGAHTSLTLNFVITATAFISIIILFLSTMGIGSSEQVLKLESFSNGLPNGISGVMAAVGYSCWFFLGVEGTVVMSGECKNASRSIPMGSVIALVTLLIGGSITWYTCSGLIPADILGDSVYPLYEAAIAAGGRFVSIALFTGSILACFASANGCINDASSTLASLSEDKMLPDVFACKHKKYGSNARAVVFLFPIALAFALTGMLDQVVTFSIFSALMVYLLTCVMMLRFRRKYPIGTIDRGFTAPFFPALPVITAVIVICGLFGLHYNYGVNLISGALFYFLASVWLIRKRKREGI